MRNKELVKNKICTLIFVGIGLVPTLMDNDNTFFIFSLMMSSILFFSKEELMVRGEVVGLDY